MKSMICSLQSLMCFANKSTVNVCNSVNVLLKLRIINLNFL